tara:strand:+ start:175 stop:342 length:168 start_codon:yes stop_codon:yes gene_type:complete
MGITELLEKLQNLTYQLEEAIESQDWDDVNEVKGELDELLLEGDRAGFDSFDTYE